MNFFKKESLLTAGAGLAVEGICFAFRFVHIYSGRNCRVFARNAYNEKNISEMA